jgi:hypothetical protein
VKQKFASQVGRLTCKPKHAPPMLRVWWGMLQLARKYAANFGDRTLA